MSRRESREPGQKPRKRRLGPELLEVRHPSHDKDDVERAVADDLVGDVDVAAARVTDLRDGRSWRGHDAGDSDPGRRPGRDGATNR